MYSHEARHTDFFPPQFGLFLSHCLWMSPSRRVKVSPSLACHCSRLHKRGVSQTIIQERQEGHKNSVMFTRGRMREKESERNLKKEKKMGDAFETPWGDKFTSCLFSATSATAKLTGPERSGEILPIIVWLTESFQQPIVGGKKITCNAVRSTWSEVNNDQNPSAMCCISVMKGQNQPTVLCPESLLELTLKPPFVSSVFRSLMLREAVTFN